MRSNDVAVSRGRFHSECGSSIKIIYTPCLQKDGTIELEESGKFDMQPEIDAFAQTCSLEALLTRFANGDTSALNRYQPMYLDLTEMPKTLAEAMQHLINAEYAFDRLPVEVKQKYDNNWRHWVNQAGTDSWFENLGIKQDIKDEEEVKQVEPEQ